MISDKFIPSEWFNWLFTEIKNCDIVSRPTKTWFQHPLFWFITRPWLRTQIGAWGIYDWQADGDIKWWHYNDNKIYPYTDEWTLYEFDGSDLNSLSTLNYYDSTKFNKTLQVSFAWGGRYPDAYTVFTVASYDAVNAEITINETLSAWQQTALVWKYVYMKTGAAQWGLRRIDSIPAATNIKLASWFWASPTSWNVLWIYNKFISQSRFPQVRQWTWATYFFQINSTITIAPVAWDTYTNNSFTYTIISTDLSSGKWVIKCTGTWDPELAWTLTRTAWSWDASITFYDSDIWDERFLAYDNDWNIMYWYFPNAKKIIQWDNRLFQMHTDLNNILPTDSTDLEIILTTKIIPSSSDIMNIDSYSWFFVIFYKDRIWILRKTITNASTQDFVYTYQDVVSVGLYSEESYIKRGGNLYFFGNDNILYSLDLSSNGSEVIGKPTNQWQIMIEYFKQITWGEVLFRYSKWILRMIHRMTAATTVYKFFESYKWWIIDEYVIGNNLFAFMNNINTFDYIPKWEKIFRMDWFIDDETTFTESVKMEWPLQEFLDTEDLEKIKLRFGFDWLNRIAGKVKIEIWWTKIDRKEVDITDTERINEINSYVEWNGMIWGSIIGDVLLWWTPWFWELVDYYSPYQDVTVNVGKKWQRCRIEIFNDSQYQMIFGWLKVNQVMYPSNAVTNKTVL